MVKNYENTKIYKIVCNETGLIYVGSTTKKYLSQRLSSHVTGYKQYKMNNNLLQQSSYQVLEAGNFNIHLLELYPCSNVDAQAIREKHYINILDCVNKNVQERTKREYDILNYTIDQDVVLKKQPKTKNKICYMCNYESEKMKGRICCNCYNVLQNQRYHDKYKFRHIVYMPMLSDQ